LCLNKRRKNSEFSRLNFKDLDRKTQLKRFLEMQPKDPFLLYAMGLEHFGAADYMAAEPWFEKCREADNEYLAVYYQLGKTKENLNKDEEAIAVYEAGIALAEKQKAERTLNELRSALEVLQL